MLNIIVILQHPLIVLNGRPIIPILIDILTVNIVHGTPLQLFLQHMEALIDNLDPTNLYNINLHILMELRE